jgi:hypothetical protein
VSLAQITTEQKHGVLQHTSGWLPLYHPHTSGKSSGHLEANLAGMCRLNPGCACERVEQPCDAPGFRPG